jgi:hypothetical protein
MIPCFWVEPLNDLGEEGLSRWVDGHGGEWTDYTLPPGAMLDGTWWHDIAAYVRADGISLIIVLPPEHIRSDDGQIDNRGNWWDVDGPNVNGAKWQRTGDPRDPPSLSITPSINTREYHGFVMAGILTDDLGGHVQ